MPVGGTGMGDDVGNLNQPSIFELETKASVEISKAQLGIIRDTLEVSFIQIGEKDLWKYQASSSRPTLAPLASTRMETATLSESDVSWKGIQEELLKQLPDDVQLRYARDNEKPIEERSEAFRALGEAVKTLAKLIAQFGIAKADSVKAERKAELNAILPSIAHEESVALSGFINMRAFDLIESFGSNMPYFDKLSGTIQQFDHAVSSYRERAKDE